MASDLTVVDLGSHPHGADSVEILRKAYEPRVLYGFDPLYSAFEVGTFHRGGTRVVLSRSAAYTFDGRCGLHRNGTSTSLMPGDDADCFDVATFLLGLTGRIVLKMDVEGAEYDILARLKEAGADERLERILVEWHAPPQDYGLACPVELWEH